MSDFKDFSKKATQEQNNFNPKSNADKIEKPIQPTENDTPLPVNNEKENKH
ncbi:hypothetical protein [Acinetobacter seifertii]|uniref:hypothetical protein n=1 Tax=Acinetobacter seifertii TaxID=1530123 RepID=UPI001903677A|nr:hypothetical protein [Acinetobacter seifertii]MBJ9423855.1 hypothetical protein [Acinetobacter seifertii]